MPDYVKKLISVVPNNRQLKIQEMGYYVFFHYGINTFINKEWSNGNYSSRCFNPSMQDTNQWCRAVKASGAKGVILTAKHHDGFCLWQTKTTEYSIKNSPYKNGKGDIVKEVSESAREYGLKFGIYLSPWDRNSKYYGTQDYDDFYCRQLKELLTNYGDIFCMWFDGACGASKDGKTKQKYDFDKYFELIHSIQPDCILSNLGPDVRWVGNEGGRVRDSEWCVVPYALCDKDYISDISQKDKNELGKMVRINHRDKDLGSREALKNHNKLIWYPAEADVSIRLGWFYHWWQFFTIKSSGKLFRLYNNVIGSNALLLLNIPPNKKGLLADRDVKNLKKLGEKIRKSYNKLIHKTDMAYDRKENIYHKSINLNDIVYIRKIVLKEDTRYSQRVEKFNIKLYKENKITAIYNGTIIGFSKFVLFKRPQKADRIDITIEQSRSFPIIDCIEIYG